MRSKTGFGDSRVQGFKWLGIEKHRNPRSLESLTPVLLALAFFMVLLLPSLALADRISGSIELGYTSDTTTTEDSGGLVTRTKNSTFVQRYFLTLDKQIYPNLKFLAGGNFEKTNTKNDDDSTEIETTSTVKGGYLNLQLTTQMISAGLGYTKREDKQTIKGLGSTIPSVMETYSANLGLRPEGLPSVDMLFLRTHLYDKQKISQDSVTDLLSVATRYQPIRDLDLRGQVSLSDYTDRIGDINVKTISYSGRASYSRKFGDRVSTFATYTFSSQETETIAGGSGNVYFQVFPFSGFSSLSDTPALVTLDPNPAIIDGDTVSTSGVNIGHVPIGGDFRKRNIGLDFVNPSEVNTIYLWVDKDLPAPVSNSFSWEIWISSDNLVWTLHQTVPSAPFGPFYNRFEINISAVTARYLKVVTSPLPAAVIVPPALNDIFVTEMQAFQRRSSQDVAGKRTNTTHVYDLSAKWRILDRPNLSYDFYYWGTRSEPLGTSLYIVTNALNLAHRFNNVFTGAARIGRENSSDGLTKRSANVYTVSVTATPLRTLFHSLVASGRFEQNEMGSRDNNSLFLNNSAELYKGVHLNLSGGVTLSHDENGRSNVTTILNSGAAIVPNPLLNLNFNYSQSNSSQTGGGQADTTTFTRRADISAGYTPFSNLYIFASVGINAESDRETIIAQNYAVSWSPFQDGDLQFNFAYTESITSEGQKDRTVSPSLRWNLRRNVQLDASYSFVQSESPVQKSKSKILSLNLRTFL